MRVYEIARDLGIDNKALVNLLHSIGVTEVRNHMSVVGPEAVERVKRHLERQTSSDVVEERIRPTVVKRRALAKPGAESARSAPMASPEPIIRSAPAASQRAVASSPMASAPRASAPRAAEPLMRSSPAAAPLPSAPRHEPPPPAMVPPPELIEESPVGDHAARPPAAVASVEAETAPAAAPELSQPEPPPPPAAVEEAKPPSAPPPSGVAPVAAAAAPPPRTPAPQPPARPTSPPKTGIEVWEGRPGVTMPVRTQPTPRRVQYDAKAGAGLGARGRGPMGPGGRGGPRGPGGMRGRGIGQLARPKGTGQVVTQERSAHKKIVKIESSIGLQVLAQRMSIKATDVLMKLMRLGMTGVNINSNLDADTAKIVASEFGWEVSDTAVTEEEALVAAQGIAADDEERFPRPPVVTVMGHVDHGKTSLLDKIRKANVVAGEAGGITQHIGAYSVETPHGTITFLDTPGHEAFTAMRARGAQTTDLVILVVAADDGVMPQTVEALNHAKAAQVPIVVAINKCDKPDAQPERARRELSEHGLVPEEWGGETLFQEVSAVTGAGVEELLEKVVLQSEVLELGANPEKPGSGVVVEAELDRGRGPVATVLVQDGTLNRGDVVLAGSAWGKIRAMLDDRGRNVASAGPATPVIIIGLDDVPAAGDPVHVIKDAKKAQELAESRKHKERRSLMPGTARISLEDLAKAMAEGEQLELKVIIKADVQGSVEALRDALVKMSTEKVKVSVVHAAVGAITEGDVNLAVAAGSIIIGFNVRPAGKATGLAVQEGIQIRQYNIIYNVVDDVKLAMEGMLAPTLVEKVIGQAEVRQTFKISKAGMIAGCMVTQGVVRRSASARLVRDSVVVWTGKINSLKRFKDDVREVKEGFDCGIGLEGYNDLKEGDTIEFFELEEVKQTL